ncbi:hypothetical protein DNFV4_04474 [Nitrospira tepida]|uniref:Uncharacterized protein n=1 Tax=Nitrospira tepida TaxID=2973512 RepID=A0AA86N3N7_9BACT|nr:hypothetical protein DNFV4_04474 [Nitrospira tepida]
MVKTKAVPVLNPDTMKAGEVVKKVQQGLGNPTVLRAGKQGEKFTMDTHIRCWRRYKVRPPKGSQTPWETDPKYCVYDKLHNDYGYTQEWVDFLIEELKDDAKFDAICKTVSSTPAK